MLVYIVFNAHDYEPLLCDIDKVFSTREAAHNYLIETGWLCNDDALFPVYHPSETLIQESDCVYTLKSERYILERVVNDE